MTELLLNPRLRVVPIVDDGRITAYALSAPVKGRGRQRNTVSIDRADRAVIDILAGLVRADADLEVDEALWPALADLGVLIEAHEVAEPVAFACRLTDEAADEPQLAALAVNRHVSFAAPSELLAAYRELTGLVAPCAQLALVMDPATGAHFPYWLDEADHVLVRRVITREIAPADLAPTDRRRLAAAQILVDEQAVAAARHDLAAARSQFAKHAYANLPRLIPPLVRAALCSYYQGLIREGHVADHDEQVPLRSAQHDEPLMRYFHHQLRGVFAYVAGQPIKPSYSYFGAYRRGAALAKHLDRDQCKLTASLLIDYAFTPPDDPIWPLYLELPPTGQPVAALLDPGDCVLFSGCIQPHYRRALRAERSTSLLFHYVDEAFTGSLY